MLYWFCQTSTWICHRYTRVPHPEPPSVLPPRTIPLGRLSAPAPSKSLHFLSIPRLLYSISFKRNCLKIQLLQYHSILFSISHPGIISFPYHTSYLRIYFKIWFSVGTVLWDNCQNLFLNRYQEQTKKVPLGAVWWWICLWHWLWWCFHGVYFYPQIHQGVYNIYRFLYVSHTSIILWFLFRSNKSFDFY